MRGKEETSFEEEKRKMRSKTFCVGRRKIMRG
jgi:hypothetical protein